jgi:glycosyltransferase involved in cell wall biosynthesis
MGRLMWDKGVGEFVSAARVVRATCPQARFVLLGYTEVSNPSAIGPQQVQAWVDEGLVEYRPPAQDVRPHLADADCVVLPSYREGVPRSLLEAGAMARPVITTDVPGCRDAVVDGVTGFLCRPQDAQSLAERMLRFAALPANERANMGAAGRDFVQARFDELLVLERYMQVVQALQEARTC